jgi:hypothetical protein
MAHTGGEARQQVLNTTRRMKTQVGRILDDIIVRDRYARHSALK